MKYYNIQSDKVDKVNVDELNSSENGEMITSVEPNLRQFASRSYIDQTAKGLIFSFSRGYKYTPVQLLKLINSVTNLRRFKEIDPKTGFTLLHWAVFYDMDISVLKDLVSKVPGMLEKKDNNGATPLMLAAKIGNYNAVEFLINVQSNLDAQDKKGNTSLHVASGEGNTQVVEKLVNSGVNTQILNHDRLKAIHLAMRAGYCEIFKILLSFETKLIENEETDDEEERNTPCSPI